MEELKNIFQELNQCGIKTDYEKKVDIIDILKIVFGFYAFVGNKKVEIKKTYYNKSNTKKYQFLFFDAKNEETTFSLREILQGKEQNYEYMFERTRNISELFTWLSGEYEVDKYIVNSLVEVLKFDIGEIDMCGEKIRKIISFIEKILYRRKFSFVTGTGVTYDYHGQSWNDIIKKCEKQIGIANPGLNVDYISQELFNTNYSVPQIMKDTNESLYHNIVGSSVGKWINLSPRETCVDAITDYLKKHNMSGRILTYNYDAIHEDSLFNKGVKFEQIFKRKTRKNKADPEILVVHPHGFYLNDKSIVLTNDEYMDAYKSLSKKVPQYLWEQLDNNNVFVGNSVKDYEEQKVLTAKFKSNYSNYHFLLRVDDPAISLADKNYITQFFLRMGLVVVWLPSYSYYISFIKSL